MAAIVVLKPFQYSDDGINLTDFEPSADGLAIDVTDECARVAVAEGWATRADIVPEPDPEPDSGGDEDGEDDEDDDQD